MTEMLSKIVAYTMCCIIHFYFTCSNTLLRTDRGWFVDNGGAEIDELVICRSYGNRLARS